MKKLNWIILILIIFFIYSCNKEDTTPKLFQEDEPVTDWEGNTYKTVKIGDQIWMAQNLRTFYYRNGDNIGQVRGSAWSDLRRGAHCYYEGETNLTGVYVLYNCWAVHDERNIAPEGWHVSTEADWVILENYISSQIGADGSIAKALASTWGWETSDRPNTVGNDMSKNNSFGFNAEPCGYRHPDGDYVGAGKYANFWLGGGLIGSNREILWLSNAISGGETGNQAAYGYAVRCVKD